MAESSPIRVGSLGGPPLKNTNTDTRIATADEEHVDLAKAIAAQAHQLITSIEIADAPAGLETAGVRRLRKRADTLVITTDNDGNEVESYIVTLIMFMARREFWPLEILLCLEEQLKSIIRDVLGPPDNGFDNVLWRILEKCKCQATRASGTLHVSHYFASRSESALEPQNPDLGSKEEHDAQARREIEEKWTAFWAQALGKCPDGSAGIQRFNPS